MPTPVAIDAEDQASISKTKETVPGSLARRSFCGSTLNFLCYSLEGSPSELESSRSSRPAQASSRTKVPTAEKLQRAVHSLWRSCHCPWV